MHILYYRFAKVNSYCLLQSLKYGISCNFLLLLFSVVDSAEFTCNDHLRWVLKNPEHCCVRFLFVYVFMDDKAEYLFSGIIDRMRAQSVNQTVEYRQFLSMHSIRCVALSNCIMAMILQQKST